jgi:hypothetical protein
MAISRLLIAAHAVGVACNAATPGAEPDFWANDFSRIAASDWNYDRAADTMSAAPRLISAHRHHMN